MKFTKDEAVQLTACIDLVREAKECALANPYRAEAMLKQALESLPIALRPELIDATMRDCVAQADALLVRSQLAIDTQDQATQAGQWVYDVRNWSLRVAAIPRGCTSSELRQALEERTVKLAHRRIEIMVEIGRVLGGP